mgnify:CR=1 FL=1
MGLFKKLKKAFKKITGAVKKVVKKVVKGVKKVVKKIGSSKIFKALAIAGAAIVTGGAALGAFGGTGALASSQFGGWMMKVSSKALSGSVFGGSGVLSKVGNFAIKTAAKPFGVVGGALGSTARVGANIVQGKSAFAAGPATAAPTPFSGAALTGQLNTDNVYYDADTNSYIDKVTGNTLTDNEVSRLPFSFTEAPNTLSAEGEVVKAADVKDAKPSPVKDFAKQAAYNVGMDVVRGGVAQYMQGDPDPSGTPLPGGDRERATGFDPLRIYASENNIDASSIYNQTLYGNSDPSSVYGADLFSQATVEVTA